MEYINKLIKSYDLLSEKYGHKESYLALKKHYCDICSNGDYIINKIIDGLYSNNNNYYKNLLNEYKNDEEFVVKLIDDYLIDTINDFINNGLQPDPFWAD